MPGFVPGVSGHKPCHRHVYEHSSSMWRLAFTCSCTYRGRMRLRKKSWKHFQLRVLVPTYQGLRHKRQCTRKALGLVGFQLPRISAVRVVHQGEGLGLWLRVSGFRIEGLGYVYDVLGAQEVTIFGTYFGADSWDLVTTDKWSYDPIYRWENLYRSR